MQKFSAVVKYQGGLGNQLFQWAFAHLVAKTHNVSQDVSWFQSNKDREFEIRDLVLQCIHLDELLDNKSYFRGIGEERFRGIRKIRKTKLIDDRNFLSEDWKREPKLSVSGYFQSEKSFGKIESEVKPELRKFLETNVNLALEFNVGNVVALHVRRGDYLEADVKKNIGVLKDEYFMKQLRDETGPYLILTENEEDVAELTSRIKELDELFICDSRNLNSWETLKVMMACRKFIGSNSSLSWWGAYLRDNDKNESSLPEQWTKGGVYAHPGKESMSKCSYIPSIWKA